LNKLKTTTMQEPNTPQKQMLFKGELAMQNVVFTRSRVDKGNIAYPGYIFLIAKLRDKSHEYGMREMIPIKGWTEEAEMILKAKLGAKLKCHFELNKIEDFLVEKNG